MKMTRQHFQAIATIIKSGNNYQDELARRGVAIDFADMLAQSNPLFQRARFLEACKPGLTTEERKAIVAKIEGETL